MNLSLTFEALKFYKVRHERTVQLGFVLLYLINIVLYFLPIGDTDFTAFNDAFNAIVAGQSAVLPVLTTGNWITLGLMALASLINLFATFFYAALFVGEAAGQSIKQIVGGCLRALPRLLLFMVLLLVPSMFTAILFLIPLLIFVTMMYFLPLHLMHERQTLPQALHNSFTNTRGSKMNIFFQMFFLSILVSLPKNLFLTFAPQSELPVVLIETFFTVLQALAQGRLMGMLYLFLVKKVPIMIPSKPTNPTL
jgi:hypothetical protein